MNNHRSSQQYADKHFSNVGWNNVTVEIIDTANSDEELSKKEHMKITEFFSYNRDLLLNKNNYYDISQNYKNARLEPITEPVYFSEINILPSEHWFCCQRKIDEYYQDVFKFIKTNRYIIKQVCGARLYISKCVAEMKRNKLENDEARKLIMNFLKDKPWKGKCVFNSRWSKGV